MGNDPAWLKITRSYPEMCLNGVNATKRGAIAGRDAGNSFGMTPFHIS